MAFHEWFAALGLVYLALVAWPLARIDFQEHRLPNRLVLPSFAVTLLGHLLAVLSGATLERLLWAWLTGLVVFVVAVLANFWAGLGMGDVKLMAAMAVVLGWWGSGAVVFALAASFVLAASVTGLRLLAKRARLADAIALGPYLLGGFAAASVGLFV